jgi:hypothetical protein
MTDESNDAISKNVNLLAHFDISGGGQVEVRDGRELKDEEQADLLRAPIDRAGDLHAIAEHGYEDGGFKVYDISDPLKPKERGYYIPQPADGFPAQQSNDVDVDKNGVIYGLDILELAS